ncbi:RNA helicase Mov10l1-like [Actinia tenebrosa]|uniref:RNA helicase n=1 Tax=Actinia tenebrosa TaxID=6105 RepID=A0A6P8J1C3_ACTTE|nr:RNA helicase Mov10l1-like [Actinia tenebrosa]
MFNIISKFTGYVFGSDEDGNSSIAKNKDKSPQNPKDNSSKKVSNSVKKDEDLLRKSCYGKVSRLYDGAGVIDDEVYFTFDVIIGGSRLEVGNEVHFEAKRENNTSGWKATRVRRFKEWGTFQENGVIENAIGFATALKGDILELNNGMSFNMSVLKHQPYSPCKGDWVKVELERFTDDSLEIRGVKPLREKNLSGKVNSVFPGYGYINEEVYFTFGACVRGYRPCRGDDVQVTAVESVQGKCKWRAVNVEPKKIPKQNSPCVGNLQQFLGNKMAELLSDKHGIVISGNLDFGDIAIGQSRTLCINIKNTDDKEHTFKSWSFVRADPQFEIQLLSMENHSPVPQNSKRKTSESATRMLYCGMQIPSQETRNLNIKFTAKNLGRVKQLVVLAFDCGEIGRHVTSNVVDDHQDMLAPVTPYQRNRNRGREAWDRFVESGSRERWIVPGERPTRKTKLIFPIKLKMYSVPRDIRNCIMDDRDLTALVPVLTEPLTMQNHAAKFGTLLYAEELQMELDMREFDLQNVTMDLYREYLSLRVPGLAEGRPSLLIGDTVVASLTDGVYDAPKYEGYVHEVRKDDILLKFNEEFHKNFGLQSCDVTFYFNRSTIRRAHQAVEFAAQLGPEVMFPRKLEPKLPVVNLCLGSSNAEDTAETSNKEEDFLYNSNLNERQRAAVSRILSGQSRPTPYILFGPPGTGKTVTLVEAILQAFHRIPSSRIIACAPSNSAADLLAVRLQSSGFIQEGDMVRLNAVQRAQDIPETIVPYCLDTDRLTLAAHYRIIICTCSTSGQLFSLGLRAGHFTHVFVDEAGQATEPDCLIPMGLAAGGEGQIILAGDPHQLGPVLRSTLALEYGLNISLLERLMSRPLYTRDEARFIDHGCYDPLLVTKLVNNYRSHPVLLHLPSALFYHNELRVHADEKMRERFGEFEMLPKKGAPLVFHGVKGEDLREGNSPSWFNPAEAVQIIRYIQGLKKSEACSIKPTDIGIISPYKKQVEKIRLLLRRVGIDDVKVGSVEEFQGQERPVIIISTVRSDQSYIGSDVDHSIGFLSNPKRFNVAITRAQALLIVIGNPHVLCQDPYWCSLVQYCVMNDVYTGCDLPDLDSELYQEEFHYALNVISQIASNSESGNHGNDEETITDEVCATLKVDASASVSSSVTASNNTQQITTMHLSDKNLLKKDSQISEQGKHAANKNQNYENLVEHSLNELNSSASEKLENTFELSLVAKQHQSCVKTRDKESSCYDDEPDPRGYRTSSACLFEDAINGTSNGVYSENVLKATTGSPTDIGGFSRGLPGIEKTMSQQTDIFASKASLLQSQENQVYHKVGGNVTTKNDEGNGRIVITEGQKSNSKGDQTCKVPDSSCHGLTNFNNTLTSSNIHRENQVMKNVDSSNLQLKVDFTTSELGLPVDDPLVCVHVMNTSLPPNDASDEEDLEEFFIKPMN